MIRIVETCIDNLSIATQLYYNLNTSTQRNAQDDTSEEASVGDISILGTLPHAHE